MERERAIVDERRAGAAIPACLLALLVPGAGHLYLGNTFTEVGGLLNILVVLDAYDVAVGRKR
jgi:hypothetical protein